MSNQSLSKANELILAVPTKKVFPQPWHGLNQELIKGFEKIVRSHGKFKRRGIPGEKGLENDPTWKQIIPYMVFKFGDRYFLMQRGNKGHETRLHNMFTLGIGGHINKKDLQKKAIIDWGLREFEEEVEYAGNLKATPVGLLYDNKDVVGGTHLGYAILLEGDSDQIAIKDELLSGRLVTLQELETVYPKMETWSQMVVDYLKVTSRDVHLVVQPHQEFSKLAIQTRGRFIVIEGTDGSGKGTQTQLLKEKLDLNGIPNEIADFPRYEQNIYGRLVGRYLRGDFGGVNEVSPYLASLTYAGDRLLAKEEINKWLNEGKLVISNRYVMSNKAHMTGKLPLEEREAFIQWLEELEYRVHGIPREELVVFLYVPPEIGQKNVDQKASRKYLGSSKRDIHEADANHLSNARDVYLKLAKDEPHWVVIECTENGEMKSREEIHQQIMKVLVDKGILK